jgi:type IV fimbrial biogenesis protein FimT
LIAAIKNDSKIDRKKHYIISHKLNKIHEVRQVLEIEFKIFSKKVCILASRLLNKSVEANNMNNRLGFTLIELMVVIAILALVSAIGVPSLIGWRDDAKLRDAVSLLRGDLEMAKIRAVRENDFVAVLFNANGYTVFIDDGAGDPLKAGDWIVDPSERILRNRQLPAGVSIDLGDLNMFTNDRTRFNARGRISNVGIVTVFNIAGSQKQIDMNNRFGRISVN